MEVKAKDAGGLSGQPTGAVISLYHGLGVIKLPAMQMEEGTPRSGEVWGKETCLPRVRVCATAGAGSLSQTKGAVRGNSRP